MTAPAPSSPAPAKSGNRTLLIIGGIVLGLLLLVGGCTAGCTWYVGHKARDYAKSAQKNPQLAAISLAASFHPDIEVVSKDEDAGRITLRNKRTGEVVKFDSANFTPARAQELAKQFAAGQHPDVGTVSREEPATPPADSAKANQVRDDAPANNEPAPISPAKAAALAATLKQFPAIAPVYPRGQTVDATRSSFSGSSVGTYVFQTKDAPADIVAFYAKRATQDGCNEISRNEGTNDFGPTAYAAFTGAEPQRGITVAAESEEGGTVRAVVSFTTLAK